MLLTIFPVPSARSRPTRQTGRDHDEAFAQDHPLHGVAFRAERHANADLARPPRHRVGFDAVDADHGEPEREPAENRKQRRRRAHEPELRVALHVVGEGAQLENRQHRIDALHRAAKEIGGGGFVAGESEAKRTKKKTSFLKPRAKGR